MLHGTFQNAFTYDQLHRSRSQKQSRRGWVEVDTDLDMQDPIQVPLLVLSLLPA